MILIKYARVNEFKFRISFAPPFVFVNKPLIRVILLRIFIQHFHIGVGGCAVEIIVIFLNIFSMVALVSGKPEISFLQYWILFIPERQGETQNLVFITDTSDSLFPPTVRFTPGHIMTYKFPGGSIFTVVFSHGSPLAICYIGSPFFPLRKINT